MSEFPPGPQCWWPVLTARALTARAPQGILLNGLPLVLFRDPQQRPVALADSCPHRAAPLSQGRCLQGQIQCPYHGWTFDHGGRCTRVPGAEQMTPAALATALVRRYDCQQAGGLIWVRTDAGDQALPAQDDAELDSFLMEAQAEGSLLDLAENFLEPYHTHFVHAGLVRRDRQRQPVQARLRAIAGGIEVEYSGEQGQNGWLSRLLEGSRGRSWGRFYWPNRAQIEYRDLQDQLTLRVDTWFTPQQQNQHRIFARISTRRGLWPAGLKRALLRRLFGPVLRQDLAITQAVNRNRQRFDGHSQALLQPAPLDAAHDLMGPALRELLRQHSNCSLEARSLTQLL